MTEELRGFRNHYPFFGCVIPIVGLPRLIKRPHQIIKRITLSQETVSRKVRFSSRDEHKLNRRCNGLFNADPTVHLYLYTNSHVEYRPEFLTRDESRGV